MVLDRWSYVPSVLRSGAGAAMLLTATLVGSMEITSTDLVEQISNPWDAVQVPGPDQSQDSGMYIPYASASNAYIEVRPDEIEFLQGPYGPAGVNPVTGTTTNNDGSSWAGIADANTIGSRFGFGSFISIAEGIFWAGEANADAFRDSQDRIVIRVNGDIRAVGASSRGLITVGGVTSTSKASEVWWSVGTGQADVFDTPRRISGLWIVGANWTPGDTPRDSTYQDRIGSIKIADKTTVGGAADGFVVDEISFQGLECVCTPGERSCISGSGSYDPDVGTASTVEHNHGLLRVWDCYLRGDPNPPEGGSFPDVFGVNTGSLFLVRFYHHRGCYHFYNNHYGRVEQHCHYLDYINATPDEYVENLPWYYQRRSYFKDCTMEYAGKTFLQVVNRALELPDLSDGDPNTRLYESAQGLILCEGIEGEGCVGNPSFITIVGLISYDRFPEDGTIICRDMVYRENADNDAAEAGNLGGTGPCFLSWTDGGTLHGAFWDDNGFSTTRVVIDGWKTFNSSGGRDLNNINDALFAITGTGETEIWLTEGASPNFSVGNATNDIFSLDDDCDSPHLASNPNSNNPPVDTSIYGADRTKGSYYPHNGPVRFMVSASDVPSIVNYTGWGSGTKVKQTLFEGTRVTLTTQQLNNLAYQLPAPALPVGLSFGDVGDDEVGDIFGTPTVAGTDFDGDSNYFVQNQVGIGYVSTPDFDRSELIGVEAAVQELTLQSTARIEVTQSEAITPDVAEFSFDVNPATASTEFFAPTDGTADLTFTPLSAVFSTTQNFGFESGFNTAEPIYFKHSVFKNYFWNSRSYQYLDPNGTIYPPHPSIGGFIVVLDANGDPDLNAIPPELPAGTTVVSQIRLGTSLDPIQGGAWTIRWTGAGVIDFLPSSFVGAETGRSDPGNNFVERTLTASNGFFIEVKSGPVTQVQVFPPGSDPLDDAEPFKYLWQPVADRLPEITSLGGPVRVYQWTGTERCGEGSYSGDGTPTLRGWLPGPDAYAPYKLLSDPRFSEAPDQSENGIPIEAQVQACIELGRWMWWTCPHELGDEQIRYQLEYIRDNLIPQGLGVIVELSNEIWNSNFAQYTWASQNSGGTQAGNIAFQAFVGSQCERLFDVAETVFAGLEPFLIKAVMGQTFNSGFIQGILANVANDVQFVGCAGYLNVNPQASGGEYSSTTTIQDILDDMLENLPALEAQLAVHKAIADQRQAQQGNPVRFALYECGQSIVPQLGGPTKNEWLGTANQAQRDPRMFDIYITLQEAFDRNGVDYACWFTSNDPLQDENGSWGHLLSFNHQTGDGQSPKWDAIVRDVVTNNVKIAELSEFSFQAEEPLVISDGFLVPTADLAFTAQDATTALRIVPDTAEFTVTALDPIASGSLSPEIASVTFTAFDVETVYGAYSPTVTDFDYTLPEGSSTAYSLLNVFEASEAGEPVFFGQRPILISCQAGNFSHRLPEAIIRDDTHILEFNWIKDGGMVISVGVTGFQEGGTFAGVGDPSFDDLLTNPLPEKDAFQIIKAVRQFGDGWGGDLQAIYWAGTSSGGLIGAVLMNPDQNFGGGLSEQALQPTGVDAHVQFSPVSYWNSLTQNFPGLHWPDSGGAQAASLADVSTEIKDATSLSSWLRLEDGNIETCPVFLFCDEPWLSTDLSRDTEGDPTLSNNLDWLVQLHPLWHGVIASQDLKGRTEPVHARSLLLVDNNLGDLPSNFGVYVDERFDGGVYGEEARLRARDLLWAEYFNREAEVATFTLTALVSDAQTDLAVFPDTAEFTVTALDADYFEEGNVLAELAEVTFTALDPAALQVQASLAEFVLTAPLATVRSVSDTFVDADTATFQIFALRANESSETFVAPDRQITQARFEASQVTQ